jgi:hypothetical protein
MLSAPAFASQMLFAKAATPAAISAWVRRVRTNSGMAAWWADSPVIRVLVKSGDGHAWREVSRRFLPPGLQSGRGFGLMSE